MTKLEFRRQILPDLGPFTALFPGGVNGVLPEYIIQAFGVNDLSVDASQSYQQVRQYENGKKTVRRTTIAEGLAKRQEAASIEVVGGFSDAGRYVARFEEGEGRREVDVTLSFEGECADGLVVSQLFHSSLEGILRTMGAVAAKERRTAKWMHQDSPSEGYIHPDSFGGSDF